MYEDTTYEIILKRMLNRIPDDIDKREGSIIYDALSPAAIELQQMYIELDVILQETFADTASREYLVKRTKERGITPFPATYALLKGEFNTDVPVGSRFSLNELNYFVKEQVSTGVFKLECENIGVQGNRYFGDLIPIEYINDLQSAKLTELLIPGEDEEETENLRTRYFSGFDSQAFGGNIADYKEKVHALAGIGGVKVYPVWNGSGTVKLVIINSEFKKPTKDLVDTVQNYIDPQKTGMGVGLAPIGHVVTVTAILEKKIDIELSITYQNGYSFSVLKTAIENAIDSYFSNLSAKWEDEENIIVRISQIESRLLNVAGITDIANTKINTVAGNLTLDADSIPVRGEMNG